MLFNKGVAKKAWISNKEIKKKEKQITAAQNELYTVEVEDEIYTLDFKLYMFQTLQQF